MNNNPNLNQFSLSPTTARLLSHLTKSVPMMEEISPRWLLTFLPWVPVEAGTYRVNCKKKCNCGPDFYPGSPGNHPTFTNPICNEHGEKPVDLISCHNGEPDLPQTFPDYEETPREYPLNLVQTILKIHSRVSDIYNSPINQYQQQMRLTIETLLEQEEWELVNNQQFGLLHSIDPKMRVSTRNGAPTPDDLDELLTRVWKKPAFFLAHPKAIAAFGRECTRCGVPPVSVNLFGSPFITWRGVPLVPSDKLMVNGRSRPDLCCSGTTSILLLRVGEGEQGVIGLHQPGIPDEQFKPSLSVKFGGIDDKSIARYIISLYFSLAVLTNDALGILENVEVGIYHDYA
jgi:hypothetical protein